MKCREGYKQKEGKCMKSNGIFNKPVFRKNKWLKTIIIIGGIAILVAVAVFLIIKFGGSSNAFSVSSPEGLSSGFGGGGHS